MKKLFVVSLLSLVACASGPSTKGSAAKGKGGKGDPCARIAADTRAFVTKALATVTDGPSIEDVLDALGAYAGCSDGGPAGRWGFVVEGGVELITEAIFATDEDGEQGEQSGTAVRVQGSARPVFVTKGGVVVRASEDLPMPQVDRYAGELVGDPMRPMSAVDVDLSQDYDGDGVPEAIVSGLRHAEVLRFDGKAVTLYQPAYVLDGLSETRDLDGDERADLVNHGAFELDTIGDGLANQPLAVVAHALPDGTFATDDAVTRAHYARECATFGRSPWIGAHDDESALKNMACALVHGVLPATIMRGLAAEVKAFTTTHEEVDSNRQLITKDLSELAAWLAPARPQVGRGDGRAVVTATRVTATSSAPVWKGYHFEPELAVDGDLGTSWQPKKAAAPWLELTFAGPTTITALDIGNGFQREDTLGDLFPMNRRVTSIKVSGGGKDVVLALDPQQRGYQTVVLPEPLTTAALRITVTASVDGTRWKSIAISEVRALTGP